MDIIRDNVDSVDTPQISAQTQQVHTKRLNLQKPETGSSYKAEKTSGADNCFGCRRSRIILTRFCWPVLSGLQKASLIKHRI